MEISGASWDPILEHFNLWFGLSFYQSSLLEWALGSISDIILKVHRIKRSSQKDQKKDPHPEDVILKLSLMIHSSRSWDMFYEVDAWLISSTWSLILSYSQTATSHDKSSSSYDLNSLFNFGQFYHSFKNDRRSPSYPMQSGGIIIIVGCLSLCLFHCGW